LARCAFARVRRRRQTRGRSAEWRALSGEAPAGRRPGAIRRCRSLGRIRFRWTLPHKHCTRRVDLRSGLPHSCFTRI
jgi:hypothetical protein